jgi:hypothetical protein
MKAVVVQESDIEKALTKAGYMSTPYGDKHIARVLDISENQSVVTLSTGESYFCETTEGPSSHAYMKIFTVVGNVPVPGIEVVRFP